MEQPLGELIHPEMTGLIALVFALGLRHGFDPDHLVAIDGLTRSSARVRPGTSRWSGLFFSLGHGAVVTLVGLGVAVAAADLQAPRWLEHVGAWISIGVLLVLGIGNLLMTARTPSGAAVPLVGMRGRWLSDRLVGASHPLVIASVGAAFALSFDTISHALMFSLTGASMAGALFAAMLGIVFTLGMVLTDTLNGWWVARVLTGADRRAAFVSRCVSVAIAFLCLALAAGGFAKYVLPVLEEQAAAFAPVLSVASIFLILAVYALASRFAVLR
jgi:nickel/cobalt transporter (NiCoT) family protein